MDFIFDSRITMSFTGNSSAAASSASTRFNWAKKMQEVLDMIPSLDDYNARQLLIANNWDVKSAINAHFNTAAPEMQLQMQPQQAEMQAEQEPEQEMQPAYKLPEHLKYLENHELYLQFLSWGVAAEQAAQWANENIKAAEAMQSDEAGAAIPSASIQAAEAGPSNTVVISSDEDSLDEDSSDAKSPVAKRQKTASRKDMPTASSSSSLKVSIAKAFAEFHNIDEKKKKDTEKGNFHQLLDLLKTKVESTYQKEEKDVFIVQQNPEQQNSLYKSALYCLLNASNFDLKVKFSKGSDKEREVSDFLDPLVPCIREILDAYENCTQKISLEEWLQHSQKHSDLFLVMFGEDDTPMQTKAITTSMKCRGSKQSDEQVTLPRSWIQHVGERKLFGLSASEEENIKTNFFPFDPKNEVTTALLTKENKKHCMRLGTGFGFITVAVEPWKVSNLHSGDFTLAFNKSATDKNDVFCHTDSGRKKQINYMVMTREQLHKMFEVNKEEPTQVQHMLSKMGGTGWFIGAQDEEDSSPLDRGGVCDVNPKLPNCFKLIDWTDDDGVYLNEASVAISSTSTACQQSKDNTQVEKLEVVMQYEVDGVSICQHEIQYTRNAAPGEWILPRGNVNIIGVKLAADTRVVYNPSEKCAICLETDSMTKVFLNCGHVFHRNCIEKYRIRTNICPHCRREHFGALHEVPP